MSGDNYWQYQNFNNTQQQHQQPGFVPHANENVYHEQNQQQAKSGQQAPTNGYANQEGWDNAWGQSWNWETPEEPTPFLNAPGQSAPQPGNNYTPAANDGQNLQWSNQFAIQGYNNQQHYSNQGYSLGNVAPQNHEHPGNTNQYFNQSQSSEPVPHPVPFEANQHQPHANPEFNSGVSSSQPVAPVTGQFQDINLSDNTQNNTNAIPASNSFSQLPHEPSPFDDFGGTQRAYPPPEFQQDIANLPTSQVTPQPLMPPVRDLSALTHSRDSSLGGNVQFIVGSETNSASASPSQHDTSTHSSVHAGITEPDLSHTGTPYQGNVNPNLDPVQPMTSENVEPHQGAYEPMPPRAPSVQSSASSEVAHITQASGAHGITYGQGVPDSGVTPTAIDHFIPAAVSGSVAPPPSGLPPPATGNAPPPPVSGGTGSAEAANPFRRGNQKSPYVPSSSSPYGNVMSGGAFASTGDAGAGANPASQFFNPAPPPEIQRNAEYSQPGGAKSPIQVHAGSPFQPPALKSPPSEQSMVAAHLQSESAGAEGVTSGEVNSAATQHENQQNHAQGGHDIVKPPANLNMHGQPRKSHVKALPQAQDVKSPDDYQTSAFFQQQKQNKQRERMFSPPTTLWADPEPNSVKLGPVIIGQNRSNTAFTSQPQRSAENAAMDSGKDMNVPSPHAIQPPQAEVHPEDAPASQEHAQAASSSTERTRHGSENQPPPANQEIPQASGVASSIMNPGATTHSFFQPQPMAANVNAGVPVSQGHVPMPEVTSPSSLTQAGPIAAGQSQQMHSHHEVMAQGHWGQGQQQDTNMARAQAASYVQQAGPNANDSLQQQPETQHVSTDQNASHGLSIPPQLAAGLAMGQNQSNDVPPMGQNHSNDVPPMGQNQSNDVPYSGNMSQPGGTSIQNMDPNSGSNVESAMNTAPVQNLSTTGYQAQQTVDRTDPQSTFSGVQSLPNEYKQNEGITPQGQVIASQEPPKAPFQPEQPAKEEGSYSAGTSQPLEQQPPPSNLANNAVSQQSAVHSNMGIAIQQTAGNESMGNQNAVNPMAQFKDPNMQNIGGFSQQTNPAAQQVQGIVRQINQQDINPGPTQNMNMSGQSQESSHAANASDNQQQPQAFTHQNVEHHPKTESSIGQNNTQTMESKQIPDNSNQQDALRGRKDSHDSLTQEINPPPKHGQSRQDPNMDPRAADNSRRDDNPNSDSNRRPNDGRDRYDRDRNRDERDRGHDGRGRDDNDRNRDGCDRNRDNYDRNRDNYDRNRDNYDRNRDNYDRSRDNNDRSRDPRDQRDSEYDRHNQSGYDRNRDDYYDRYGDRRHDSSYRDPRYDGYDQRRPSSRQGYDSNDPYARPSSRQGAYPERPSSRQGYPPERPSSRQGYPADASSDSYRGYPQDSRPRSRQGYPDTEYQARDAYGYPLPPRPHSRSGYEDYYRPRSRPTSRGPPEAEQRSSSRPSSRQGYGSESTSSATTDRPSSRQQAEYDYERRRQYEQYRNDPRYRDYYAYHDRDYDYHDYYNAQRRDQRYAHGYEQEMRAYSGYPADYSSGQYYDQYGYYSRSQSYDYDRASQHSASRGNTPGIEHASADQFAREFHHGSRPNSRQGGYEQSPIYPAGDASAHHGYYQQSYAAENSYTDYPPQPEPEPQRMTPLKHPIGHMKGTLPADGNMLRVLPNNPTDGQPATVEFVPLGELMREQDVEMELLKAFPGPLVKGDTHKNDVLQLCQLRARHCRDDMNMVDRENAALLWRFLELLIKQNGTVVATDVAELLMEGHEQSAMNLPMAGVIDDVQPSGEDVAVEGINRSAINTAPTQTALDRFRQLCLFGRKKDALEFAMKSNLWAQALFLAMRMGPRISASVTTRFMNSAMSLSDPLRTMYQLMSGWQPAACTMVAGERFGDWRPHLAIILSHPSERPDLDKKSIIAMGDAFAGKGHLYASQFCYLMARCSFQSHEKKSAKLVLLSSSHSLPFAEFACTRAIQCTEVYEYATSLGLEPVHMCAFQTYKFLYIVRLVDAGLLEEALGYCEVLCNTICQCPNAYSPVLVAQLAELAERLKYHDPQYKHAAVHAHADPQWLLNIHHINAAFQRGEIQHVTPLPTSASDTRASSEVKEITQGMQALTQNLSEMTLGASAAQQEQHLPQQQQQQIQQQHIQQQNMDQSQQHSHTTGGVADVNSQAFNANVDANSGQVAMAPAESTASVMSTMSEQGSVQGVAIDQSNLQQAAPIIQDGWQWDPANQQWIWVGHQHAAQQETTQQETATHEGQQVAQQETMDGTLGQTQLDHGGSYMGFAGQGADHMTHDQQPISEHAPAPTSEGSIHSQRNSESDKDHVDFYGHATQPSHTSEESDEESSDESSSSDSSEESPNQSPLHSAYAPPPQNMGGAYHSYNYQQSGFMSRQRTMSSSSTGSHHSLTYKPHPPTHSNQSLANIHEAGHSANQSNASTPKYNNTGGVFQFGVPPPLSPAYRQSDSSAPLGGNSSDNTSGGGNEGDGSEQKKKPYWPGDDDEDMGKIGGGDKKQIGNSMKKNGSFMSRMFGWGNKSKKEIKLPDDKKPTIIWDEDKKEWIDTTKSAEEIVASNAPPPKDSEIMGGPDVGGGGGGANMNGGMPLTPAGPAQGGGGGGAAVMTAPPGGLTASPSSNRFSLQNRNKGGRGGQYVDVLGGKSKPAPAAPSGLFNVLPKSQSVPANIFIPAVAQDALLSRDQEQSKQLSPVLSEGEVDQGHDFEGQGRFSQGQMGQGQSKHSAAMRKTPEDTSSSQSQHSAGFNPPITHPPAPMSYAQQSGYHQAPPTHHQAPATNQQQAPPMGQQAPPTHQQQAAPIGQQQQAADSGQQAPPTGANQGGGAPPPMQFFNPTNYTAPQAPNMGAGTGRVGGLNRYGSKRPSYPNK